MQKETQLASILEVLAKTAVAEITKLVDDGSSALRLEMCRSQRENEALKRKLLLMERELRTLRGYGEGTPDNSLNISFEVQVCDEFREVPRQNANLSTERVTRERFENCGSVSMKTEDARLQSTLIKREPVDGDWSESVLLGGDWLNVDPERSQSQAEQKISEENACGTSRAAAAVADGGEGPLCEEEEEPWPAGDPEKGLLVEPKQDPEGQPLTPPPPLMKVQCVWSEASRLGAVREKRGRRGRGRTQREMQVGLDFPDELHWASGNKKKMASRLPHSQAAGRKRRGDVWKHFSFDTTEQKTECLVTVGGKPCGHRIRGKNTTNLKRHLRTRHPEVYAKIPEKATTKTKSVLQRRSSQQPNEMHSASREKTARYRARVNNDPIARAQTLAKRRERYQVRRAQGLLDHQPISAMSAEAGERRRSQWRLAQKRRRERNRKGAEGVDLTPASLETSAESSDAWTYICAAF
ncbi:uncharacterized protein LOC135255873 isoform X2 [Anguilla rostrata]|uniref:uncharacterized protein LOC135255873 isoform X2 n=1 Tax=Anguilla rostrata TaxID=7938 RepID=UPI0030CB03C8